MVELVREQALNTTNKDQVSTQLPNLGFLILRETLMPLQATTAYCPRLDLDQGHHTFVVLLFHVQGNRSIFFSSSCFIACWHGGQEWRAFVCDRQKTMNGLRLAGMSRQRHLAQPLELEGLTACVTKKTIFAGRYKKGVAETEEEGRLIVLLYVDDFLVVGMIGTSNYSWVICLRSFDSKPPESLKKIGVL